MTTEPSTRQTIRFNGELREIDAGTTVAALLGEAPPRGVAVALNKRVLHRGRLASTTLESDDEIEVVTAVQGG